MLFWIIGLTIVLSIPTFFVWLFWWPLRLFFFSLIPAHAAYAWMGKLFIVLIVGWIGGIGIPIISFVFGMMILFALADNRSGF